MKTRSLALIAPLLALCLALAGPSRAAEPVRKITQIKDNLYRFQNNFHYSVFLVTEDGVLVTDPINKEAATWLKAEIKKRFNKPIKYLVYSHDHRDHITGGEVFADSAVVVAQEQAKQDIIAENRPTAVPDITFKERMTLELGGETVKLIFPGRSHSDNLIAIYFPKQKVVFAVDFISIKRMPFKDLGDAFYPEWIRAIKRVEHLDFEILAPGHGSLGTKADVREHRQYHETLYNEVLAAAQANFSLEEMKKNIRLDQYKHFQQYDAWRELNIEGMYRQIQLHRRGN